ncbi:type III-B CRISPR module RAMP protein Cmr6 [Persephonella sp. KM09-Lau-8]|uniref:type III-B CRISPR module RAMP protein Cmr6 n=1 Tax=Persephonella sp. KM09-Lau-8 TaxID=1158345 RepID=UPI0006899045|nr:type III-B CRISPR module RAMP protein Cmr6 [Persephonella sp. KM09-Lau-8]
MSKDKKKKSFKSFEELAKNMGINKSKRENDKKEQVSPKKSKKNFDKKQEKHIDGNFFFPKYLHQIYRENKVDNYSLYLNKYVIGKFEKEKDELKLKIDNLKHVNFGNDRYNLIKNFIENYKAQIENLQEDYFIKDKIFKPEYKLIIGLGNPSVYEVSMTLHHIYGIPYIPGQAIKGVLRSYIINEFFDLDEEEALNNELFKVIFGSQDNQGNIIFFDAFPDGKINIDVDIMNPHFPEYYEDKEGKIPPADWQNPRPIKFLVVKNTPFKFFIGMKKRTNIPESLKKFENDEKIKNASKLLEYILELLKEAFEFNGIGAKTSIGYGYLQ